MRHTLIAVALALAAALAGCATPTPYQPNIRGQAAKGGFTDLRLTDNRFRVAFSGNTLTGRDTVERYMLYRAAELTVAQGHDWFEMDERRTDRDQQTYIEPGLLSYSGFGPYGYWQPSWAYYGRGFGWRTWDPFYSRGPFLAGQYGARAVERFEARAEVILHKGPQPADSARAFDARQVLSNLEATIVRPQPR